MESVGYQQLVEAATLGRVKLVFWGSLVRADSHWRVLFLVYTCVSSIMAGQAKEQRDEWEVKLFISIEVLNIAAATEPAD